MSNLCLLVLFILVELAWKSMLIREVTIHSTHDLIQITV